MITPNESCCQSMHYVGGGRAIIARQTVEIVSEVDVSVREEGQFIGVVLLGDGKIRSKKMTHVHPVSEYQ